MSNIFGNIGNNNVNMGIGMNPSAATANYIMNQTLNAEEISFLQKKGPQFNFKLTREEYLRAVCTHKHLNTGNIALTTNSNGTRTCSICDTTFSLLDLDRAHVENICLDFHDLFQTIKTLYGPIPTDSGREFYAFAGFINRIPELYELAIEYFRRLGGNTNSIEENRNIGSLAMLTAMNNPGAFQQMGINTPNIGSNVAYNVSGNQVQVDASVLQNLQQQIQMQAAQLQQMQATQQGSQQTGVPGGIGTAGVRSNNPVGFVEETQTVTTGPQGQVTSSWKG